MSEGFWDIEVPLDAALPDSEEVDDTISELDGSSDFGDGRCPTRFMVVADSINEGGVKFLDFCVERTYISVCGSYAGIFFDQK